jgi:hypothetical protein
MQWMFPLIGSPVIAFVLSGVMTLIITLGSLV